jgi:hypothetical protein
MAEPKSSNRSSPLKFCSSRLKQISRGLEFASTRFIATLTFIGGEIKKFLKRRRWRGSSADGIVLIHCLASCSSIRDQPSVSVNGRV